MKLAFLIGLLLLIACGGEAPQPEEQEEGPLPEELEPDEGTFPEAPLKEFTVKTGLSGFTPDTITVQQGDRVRITFVSKDFIYDVTLPHFGMHAGPFGKGEEEIVQFTADKKGTFVFACDMCGSTGTLVVE